MEKEDTSDSKEATKEASQTTTTTMTTRSVGSTTTKRSLPTKKDSGPSKRYKENMFGPCIVGESGSYSIIKLLIQAPTGACNVYNKSSLADFGIETRTCEWMTKDLYSSFFKEEETPTTCVSVLSVSQGSLANTAGFETRDIIVFPDKDGAWKLLDPEKVYMFYVRQYREKSKVNVYVARKLPEAEKAKLSFVAHTPDEDQFVEKTSEELPLSDSAKLSEVDEEAVQAVLSIPSRSKHVNAPKKKDSEQPKAILRSEMGVNDVVLGAGGYDQGIYRDTIASWWQRYELATHSRKRDVCKHVVREMIDNGVRFLLRVDDGSRGGYYTVEPEDSTKISNKVLRALRQEVLDRTDNLSHTERNNRHAKITAVRKEARLRERRDEEVAARAMTSLSKSVKQMGEDDQKETAEV